MDETTARQLPPTLVDCPLCGEAVELVGLPPHIDCTRCRITVEVDADVPGLSRPVAAAA